MLAVADDMVMNAGPGGGWVAAAEGNIVVDVVPPVLLLSEYHAS